jgi:hypothetical protein
MQGTALENGLRHDWYIDERSNPEKATVAAATYLKTLADTFNGDWQLALASYNSGPGRVQKAIKRVGRSDFWSLSPSVLPRETREYVPMILAAIVIARNPAQYGFSFESVDGPAFETVRRPRAVELKRVAELFVERDGRLVGVLNERTLAAAAEDVDVATLARSFKVSGGNIANIALAAAFLAAEEGSAITMPLIHRAARREFQKIGRVWDDGSSRTGS